jgi:hypothetical protein
MFEKIIDNSVILQPLKFGVLQSKFDILQGAIVVSSNFNRNVDKAMTPEQFTQVVEAILDGKYSWACVLILRFTGYNPLHYIPYRTYNRLMKDNCPSNRNKGCSTYRHTGLQPSPDSSYQSCASKIEDLSYLEPLEKHTKVGQKISGGNRSRFFMNFSFLKF